METPKEKAIKAAYGELYIKHKPDENGWVKWNIKNDFGEENVESKVKGDKLIYRLKILRGIETNNSWTRIESEEDLPKKPCNCWVKTEDSEIIRMQWFDKFFNHYANWGKVTHYQSIETPKPPIF